MNAVIYFFGSGLAFLAGVGLVFLALVALSLSGRRWPRALASIITFLGLLLIGLSATPLPYWFYACAGVVSVAWLVIERVEALRSWRVALRVGVALIWLLALVLELPYAFTPRLTPDGQSRLYIFADSVTAGMGEKGMETWPALLAREAPLEILDYSRAGATVQTMLRKARDLDLKEGIVLLEIGGNDLLGPTSAETFDQNLDELLTLVKGPGRTIVMFE